jgi:hypothetical protein
MTDLLLKRCGRRGEESYDVIAGRGPHHDVCRHASGQTVDVVTRLRPGRRPHANARLRAHPRGRHAGVCQELEQGMT